MLVHQILRSKSTEGVLTLAPSASLSEAAALLAENRVGAVVIAEEGDTAAGILSERDIVRELARRGADCLADPVTAAMTKKLITCGPEDSAHRVLEMMTEGRFRHLPVMEDGEMTGLISIGDVVKARLAELAMENDALEGMIMGH